MNFKKKSECRRESVLEVTNTFSLFFPPITGQWENEIRRRCKRNQLSIAVFHGPNRDKFANKLHTYDVVLTTYQVNFPNWMISNLELFNDLNFK